MRDFKSMKRQRGRNRKGGGGGGGQPNNPNRAFDSNGPEGIKVRGNAQHVYERYQQLARDAASSGDRVLAENYLQHAEHYFRLLRAMQPSRPVTEIVARDSFASGYDIDFEDESGAQAAQFAQEAAEAEDRGDGEGERQEAREGRDDRDFRRDRDFRGEGRDRDREFRRDERPREDRQRSDRPRDDRQRDDRHRDDRPRDDRQRDDRPREDRPRDDRPRDDRSRDDRPREDGEGRRESRRERFERQRGERGPRPEAADPLAVVQPERAPLTPPSDEGSPVLRAEDGGESHMPAFLGRAAPQAAGAEEPAAEKPKRAPRKRKTAEPAAEDA